MVIDSIKKTLLNNEILNRICAKVYRIIGLNHKKIRGRANTIKYDKTYLKHCRININGNNNEIIFMGTGVLNDCNIYVNGNNNRILINDKVCGYHVTFTIEDSENEIVIGHKTLFCGEIEFACIEGKKIQVGNDCLFSKGIRISTGDSHVIYDMDGNRVNEAADVTIGNSVWMGQNVDVLKGSLIKENSVVGVGSVVTRKFEDTNVVIAGIPAKIVKKNIYWEHSRVKES